MVRSCDNTVIAFLLLDDGGRGGCLQKAWKGVQMGVVR